MAQVVTPWILREVHGGRGPRVIQEFVAREIENLDGFLWRWAGYGWSVTWLVIGLGAVLMVGAHPSFRRALEARHGKAPEITPSEALGARRGAIVQVVIAILLGGSLLSMLTSVEVWPFSPYRMYATIQGESLVLPRLYGVTATGEVDLRSIEDAPPFDGSRFQWALRRLLQSGRDCASMTGVARYARAAYVASEAGGVGGVPALDEIRLYSLSWRLERGAFRLVPGERTMACHWPLADLGK